MEDKEILKLKKELFELILSAEKSQWGDIDRILEKYSTYITSIVNIPNDRLYEVNKEIKKTLRKGSKGKNLIA